jgi:TolB protein
MQRRRFVLGTALPAAARGLRLAGALGLAAEPLLARAQFRVDVSGIGAHQIPVLISDFAGQSACPQPLADIIRADLTRSGQFRVTPAASSPTLSDAGPPAYAQWTAAQVEAAGGGSVEAAGPQTWQIRFRLWDAVGQRDLGGLALRVLTGDLRLAAHRIADFIYQKLTGQRGVFATRIAFVGQSGRSSYTLLVADSDGYNPLAALRSREPLMSPAWAPDGNNLAYVSFETGKPVVFVQNVRTGARRAVANFRGSNSAPAFSPDGRTLAVVLTIGAASQIFTVPVNGGAARPVIRASSIATEPVFAPDGKTLYFVSDRDGSPQIYQAGLDGSNVRRITFAGSYNVSPTISPDGKSLAFVSRQGNDYQLWLQDLASGNTRALGDGPNDGHPSFAPNGQILVYAASEGGAQVLRTVSVDGNVRTTLAARGENVREPSWGPWTTPA